MWQLTGPSTAWNFPIVLVECYFFRRRNRGLLAHSKRKMCVTYARMFKKKGCSWILYSEKHLVLRLLKWKPFFHTPPHPHVVQTQRSNFSCATSQLPLQIYTGSKALIFFSLNVVVLFWELRNAFLFLWKLCVLQLIYLVNSCFYATTVQPLSRKARRERSTCGALCPVPTLFPT